MNSINVKKYSGEFVPFRPESLKNSLSRSGAKPQDVEFVFQNIKNQLYDGIPTQKLYQLAFDLLKSRKNSYAARYSLKKALRDLGPEGFYFEEWIAKLFEDQGFRAVTGQIIQGKSVSHEIDVLAIKDKKTLAVECKFRNDVDAKISVTTPMYYLSRANDITNGIKHQIFEAEREITECWLITNAYFTTDSVKFGEFYKMNLLSWNYPENNSLKLRVDSNCIYPITCLTQLSDKEKSILLRDKCIIVKDLLQDPSVLKSLPGYNDQKRETILQEARELVHNRT